MQVRTIARAVFRMVIVSAASVIFVQAALASKSLVKEFTGTSYATERGDEQKSESAINDSVIDFEKLADSTPVTNQYSNAVFKNATAISVGFSLNEFEAKPHSGSNVVFDDGGPVRISFATPVTLVQGYFTYSHRLTLVAFDENNQPLASVSSKSNNNFGVSGDTRGITNELIAVASSKGIFSIQITGAEKGNSFVLDDLVMRSAKTQVKVLFRDHGRSTELAGNESSTQDITTSAEDLLRSSDLSNQLSLIVKAEDIETIKRNEISVELLYDKPVSFIVGKLGGPTKSIRLDRLLIALSGKFGRIAQEDSFATIFYGLGRYGAGPFTNSKSALETLTNRLKSARLLNQ